MKIGQKFSFLGALVFAVMLSSVASAQVFHDGKSFPDGSVEYQNLMFAKDDLVIGEDGTVTGFAPGKSAANALAGKAMLFDFSKLFDYEKLSSLTTTVSAIIASLAGIAMVILIGRAILRALQIRP